MPALVTTCSGSLTASGIYFEGGQWTDWGRGPVWWKREMQDFFYQNTRMFFEDYRSDGLRHDFPEKYLIAEHLPAHP